jgi:hypothetical protein
MMVGTFLAISKKMAKDADDDSNCYHKGTALLRMEIQNSNRIAASVRHVLGYHSQDLNSHVLENHGHIPG